MNNLSLIRFLIYKYFLGSVSHTTLRAMGIIAWSSIVITSFTLSLQIFIAKGFEQAFIDKMQNIYPDLIITAPESQSFNFPSTVKSLQDRYPEILHCAPSHTKPALLKKETIFSQEIITIKSIDPLIEPLVCNIEKKIVPHNVLSSLTNNNIIIGKALARLHTIALDDTITLLVQEDEQEVKSVPMKVIGFIETGISYYDAHLALCSSTTMNKILKDDTVSSINIKLRNKNDSSALVKKIASQFPFIVDNWQSLYPALVAASELEKQVGILLICLMVLVACTTITGFIFMQIVLKKRDIALLKIIGFSQKSIAHIFTTMGMLMVGTGCFTGLTIAIITGLALQKYKWFNLPDIYDVTHIPVAISFSSLVFIIALVLGLGLLATLLAVYHIRHINPSYTLRFEE